MCGDDGHNGDSLDDDNGDPYVVDDDDIAAADDDDDDVDNGDDDDDAWWTMMRSERLLDSDELYRSENMCRKGARWGVTGLTRGRRISSFALSPCWTRQSYVILPTMKVLKKTQTNMRCQQ